jgi:putative transposase
MDTAFRIEVVEDAMAGFGKPEIINTDQGSQVSSRVFTGMPIVVDITISMDGKGFWRDNVFVERLWESLEYEKVYLSAYASMSEARASIGRYLDFYDSRRPHQWLARQTPDQVIFNALLPIPALA